MPEKSIITYKSNKKFKVTDNVEGAQCDHCHHVENKHQFIIQ